MSVKITVNEIRRANYNIETIGDFFGELMVNNTITFLKPRQKEMIAARELKTFIDKFNQGELTVRG